MNLKVAAANLPSTTCEGGRRRSPRNRTETSVALDAKEVKERENEVRMFNTCKKLEEKMDDLLSKCKLPSDANLICEEILEDRAKKYMSQSKEKVQKMYSRYQDMWKGYCIENEILDKDECDDKHLVEFFKSKEEKYKPSTLWVVYSCINSYFIEKFGKNLKDFPRLGKYLKQKTHTYLLCF